MSQEEFAQHYHVTRQIVSNWEKEKIIQIYKH